MYMFLYQIQDICTLYKKKVIGVVYTYLIFFVNSISAMRADNQDELNNCPGCNQYISEERIRRHIEMCERYPATIFKEVRKLDPKTPNNLIKVALISFSFYKNRQSSRFKS